jgi:DNA polymerase epsilon subunit 3
MDEDLPRAHIKRLVKHKLSTLDNVDAKGQSFEPNIQKEALTAYGECAKIFIHYLTATANDVCRDHKRSTISDADVLAAIEECDFGELVDDVRATLDAFRDAKRTKKARDAEAKETRDEGDDDEVEKRDDGGGGDGGGDASSSGEEEEEEEEEDASRRRPRSSSAEIPPVPDKKVHHGTLRVEGVVVDNKLVLVDGRTRAVYSSTRRAKVRSIDWSPYGRVGVVNADP